MKNYDESVKMNRNRNWPYIPDHLCRILIIGGSGSGKPKLTAFSKTSTTRCWQNWFYVKDPFKYQLIINGREKVGIIKIKIPKAFIDYSQAINDVY